MLPQEETIVTESYDSLSLTLSLSLYFNWFLVYKVLHQKVNDAYHTSGHTKLLKLTGHRIRQKCTLFVLFFLLSYLLFKKYCMNIYFKRILFLLYLTKSIFREKSSKRATCVFFFINFCKSYCELFKL